MLPPRLRATGLTEGEAMVGIKIRGLVVVNGTWRGQVGADFCKSGCSRKRHLARVAQHRVWFETADRHVDKII